MASEFLLVFSLGTNHQRIGPSKAEYKDPAAKSLMKTTSNLAHMDIHYGYSKRVAALTETEEFRVESSTSIYPEKIQQNKRYHIPSLVMHANPRLSHHLMRLREDGTMKQMSLKKLLSYGTKQLSKKKLGSIMSTTNVNWLVT